MRDNHTYLNKTNNPNQCKQQGYMPQDTSSPFSCHFPCFLGNSEFTSSSFLETSLFLFIFTTTYNNKSLLRSKHGQDHLRMWRHHLIEIISQIQPQILAALSLHAFASIRGHRKNKNMNQINYPVTYRTSCFDDSCNNANQQSMFVSQIPEKRFCIYEYKIKSQSKQQKKRVWSCVGWCYCTRMKVLFCFVLVELTGKSCVKRAKSCTFCQKIKTNNLIDALGQISIQQLILKRVVLYLLSV